MNELKTLVIGATGKTGRRVAQRLEERGWPVRSGSRRAEPRFDWDDESTWSDALRGMDAVYIAYQPDLAVPGAVAAIERFTQLAREHGVHRIVLLSGRGEDGAQACEQVVQNSGAQWTIVRASWFAQNFSEGHFLDPILSGTLALPPGEVGEPFIDVADIADIAVAALADDRHAEQLYDVTGPRLLTFADAVSEIARAAGRDIRYLSIPADEYHAALTAEHVPAELAGFLTELFTTLFDGRNAHVTDDVERALGRQPRDFADYARATAATGVWRASSTGSVLAS